MAAADAFPLPRRTRDSDPFWDACREHRLVFQQCLACGAFRYPPMPGCPRCGSPELAWRDVEPAGVLCNFTIVHERLSAAFDVPFVLGVSEMTSGPRMLSRVVECEPELVAVGLPVQVIWHDVAAAETSIPVFRPWPHDEGRQTL